MHQPSTRPTTPAAAPIRFQQPPPVPGLTAEEALQEITAAGKGSTSSKGGNRDRSPRRGRRPS